MSSDDESYDTSSTVSSESMESEVIDNKGRKLPDWYFEFSDSDAEEDGVEREELKSKEQKLQEKMDSLLESSMSSNAAREWQTSLSTIIEFGKRSEEYQQRNSPNPREIPADTKDTLEGILDLVENLLENNDQEDGEKVKDAHVLKKLIAELNAQITDLEAFSAATKSKAQTETSQTVDSHDVDPTTVLVFQITESINNSRKKFLQDYNSLCTRAVALGLKNVLISLKGYYAMISLESGNTDICMKSRPWKDALDAIKEALNLLKANKTLRVVTKGDRYERSLDGKDTDANALSDKAAAWILKNSKTHKEKKVAYKFLFKFDNPNHTFIPGGGIAGLYRTLFAEMTRMCQHMDTTYFLALKQEYAAISLGYQIIKYYGKNKKESGMAAQSMISALSGRSAKVHAAINASMNGTHPLDVEELWAICLATLKPYSLQLTFLQYCYFLSIHGPSTKCLETLYTERNACKFGLFTDDSKLSLADNLPIEHNIMFNRIFVGLGMLAFATGRAKDAKDILGATISDLNWKILIGQKMPFIPRGEDSARRTPLMHSLFKPLMLPKHLHINCDLVELAYLFCASVLPASNTAIRDITFEKFVRSSRNVVKGSPQNPREYLYAMYSAMKLGDAKAALENLEELPFWKELPNGQETLEAVKVLVREGALREFFLQNCSNFSRLPVSYMQERCGLSKEAVVRVITAAVSDERRSAVTALWLENEDAILIQKSVDPTLHELVNDLESKLQEVGKPVTYNRYNRY